MRRSPHPIHSLPTAASIVTLMCFGATAAPAQSDALPGPGDTTRVRAAQGPSRWHEGTVVSADARSVRLVLAGTSDTVGYAVGPRDRWEVARGSGAHTVRGLLIGFGVGAVTGAAVIASAANGLGWGYGLEDLAIGGGIGGAIGGGIGALIGAATRSERWQPVLRPGASMETGMSFAF